MKKMLLGCVWQILGFLGTIILICSAAPHRWNYNGIEGLTGSLLGLNLMLPLVICIVLFIVGAVICFTEIMKN